MRYKKVVSTLLACAMAVTTVFTGNVSTASAAETDPTPVITYDFNAAEGAQGGTLGEGVTLKQSTNNSGDNDLDDYTDAPKFVEGRSGEAGDYAVDTEGKHGIVLPQKQLGEAYTVSFWVKPTNVAQDGWAKSILFVGRAKPDEKWVSVAMNGHNNGEVVCWSPGTPGWGNTHMTVKQDEWQMITIVQSGTNVELYQNGEKKNTLTNAHKGMEDENQFIALGTNHWDGNFHGVYDDVSVYGEALTAEQVSRLFDAREDEAKFTEGELTVSTDFELTVGRTRTIQVSLPTGISEDKMEVSFASKDPAIAAVDPATGEVTAVAAGSTEITTTVTLKDSTAEPKTAKTVVTVTDVKGKEIAADYDFVNSEGKVLTDKSGNGNDATIHGATAKFENGALVLAGGASNTTDPDYVDIPKSILNDLDDPEQFTIEVEFTKSANITNAWLFCLGATPASTGYNYLFLSPNFESGTLRSGIRGNNGGSSAGEKLFGTSIMPEMNKSYTVSMVFDNGKISLYWNGIKIKGDQGQDYINSGYSFMDDVVAKGCPNNILGYIGKSCWSPDGYFKGSVSKFRIYNKAMNDEEVQGSFSETFDRIFKEDLKVASILGRNASADEVKVNLSLPTVYEEAPITWTSDKPEIITDTGVVNNPAAATKVTLTAKVVSGALEGKTSFELTVQPADKTALNAKIAEAEEELKNAYRSDSSKAEIQKLIDEAKAATGQNEIDKLVNEIDKLLKKMDYSPLYVNPFTELEDFNPAASGTVTVALNGKKTVKAADVPEAVKEAVDVTYESLAEDIAAVDENGMVTGKNLGYAMIVTRVTAKYDKYAQEYYTLVKVDVDLSGVKASAAKTFLAKGKTTKISVTVPDSIQGATTTYRATGAVSVNKSGKVTAKAGGTGKVYVKVSASGKSITKTVTVNVAELTGAASVKAKKSITLKVNGPKGMKVKWSLDKKGAKLAKITQKGKLTAKKKGKVTVTAKVTVGKQTVTLTKKVTIKKK